MATVVDTVGTAALCTVVSCRSFGRLSTSHSSHVALGTLCWAYHIMLFDVHRSSLSVIGTIAEHKVRSES